MRELLNRLPPSSAVVRFSSEQAFFRGMVMTSSRGGSTRGVL